MILRGADKIVDGILEKIPVRTKLLTRMPAGKRQLETMLLKLLIRRRQRMIVQMAAILKPKVVPKTAIIVPETRVGIILVGAGTIKMVLTIRVKIKT